MRRIRATVLAAATLAFASVVGPVRAAAPVYVALGDSYAAGPAIPGYEKPWGCLKSSNNYAHLLASRLGYDLHDVTCSGAQTKHMTQPQGVSPDGPNPPQLDTVAQLGASVALVTLQIGGNDIGFSGIAQACIQAAIEQHSCRDQFPPRPDGTDELQGRINDTAPKIATVIQGIHSRAANARVLVLGYPGIFRFSAADPSVPASCPAMGAGESDAVYLRSVQESLNSMIASVAAANGAEYVDVYAPSEGRTACDLPALRWVEPIVPVNLAAPIHPNINGMLGMSDAVEHTITGAAAGPHDVRLPAGTPAPPPVTSPF